MPRTMRHFTCLASANTVSKWDRRISSPRHIRWQSTAEASSVRSAGASKRGFRFLSCAGYLQVLKNLCLFEQSSPAFALLRA